MVALNSTYSNSSYPAFECWNGNDVRFNQEQVKPFGINFNDKHRKSVRIRLTDNIVQEILL